MGLEAEAIALSRVSRQIGGDHNVVVYDRVAGGQPGGNALDRSFARSVLGEYLDKPKPGSIWLRSMIEDKLDPSLGLFHRSRNLSELVVIPLEIGDKKNDFIEVHFPFKLQLHNHAVLSMLADTLARTWHNRSPGTFTEKVLKRRTHDAGAAIAAPILSAENPARLSRAEYRVCLLLSHGSSIENARRELGVTMPTIRSHLRNIYAKTNTNGQSELLYHLLSFERASLSPHELKRQG